jgi:hypothetical protein
MKRQILISELTEVDIGTVDKEELIDAGGFTFDSTVPHEQRLASVIAALQNPYCFRVGDMGVKLEFSEDAPALQDVLAVFLRDMKSGL